MCVDELLVKDSHSYQDCRAGWVGFGSGHQATVMTPQRMMVGMKDYWYYLIEVVGMEVSILPSGDSDLRFALYLEGGAANWKVCMTHYFEAC